MTYSISKERAFNEMRKGYIAALLWSTTIFIGEGEEETTANGEDFNPSKGFIELCSKEVKTFFDDNLNKLIDYAHQVEASSLDEAWNQAGFDFALTRNGHGVGFWGRGIGELGDDLSDAAQEFGSVELYLADDGLIYAE